MGDRGGDAGGELFHERVTNRQRSLILLTVTLAAFLNPFTASSINLALPLITEEFSIDALTLSWIPGAYLLAFLIFLLPAGQLGDRTGRSQIFKGGTLMYTFASLLILFSPSSIFLLGCRFFQGIGGAMVFSSVTAIIADYYPPGERGRALGINVMVVYLGLSMGPFLGGILTEFFGWRSIFLVTFAVAGVTIMLFHSLPEYHPVMQRERFDSQGTLVFATALFCLYFGLSMPETMARLLLSLASIIMLIFFYSIERRSSSPILPVSLFAENRTFAFSNIAAIINYGATYAVALLLSLYLQYIRGFTPTAAGLILLIQPMIQMLLSPVAGGLSDRYQPARIATLGLGISFLSLLFFSFMNEDTELRLLYFFLGLLGLGLALFSAPNTNAIMSSVPQKFYGTASATVATMRALGMTIGMAIVMLVFAYIIGAVSITPAVYPELLNSIRLIFGVCAVVSLCGAILLGRLNGA
ncbi:MAG: MFS transporter [Methanomicrobiales archaeon]|nr:MFS transporter [Methanomicrobiales archaeon]